MTGGAAIQPLVALLADSGWRHEGGWYHANLREGRTALSALTALSASATVPVVWTASGEE
jgi:hypothetical protein